MDIAQLALAVDSRQAVTASANLDKLSTAGAKTERQFSSVRKGAENAAQGMDSLGRSSNLVGSSLARVGAAAGIAFGVSSIVAQADAWTNLNNRLRLVTGSQAELKAASNDVFNIAQRTSQAIDGTAQVYQRFAQNADALKLSLKDVAGVTDTVSKAIAISGGTQQGNEAALVQFGQALASGVFRGEEFNSVMEQTPGLIDAIARGMGVTRGEMRGLANDGKLTADVLVRALQASRASVDEQFATRVKTVSQSFIELQNSVQRYIGTANESVGATSLITGAIGLLSNNLDALATGGIALALLKTGDALRQKGVAAMAAAAASRADAAATQAAAVAAAEGAVANAAAAAAKVRDTAAQVAQLASTNAAIAAERGLVVAQIAATDTQIARSTATIAATTANGAMSASLRLRAIAETELAAAEARRLALVTQLGVLGAQQGRVTAAQTAALAAQATATTAAAAATGTATVAQTALNAAQGVGATAARAASAAIGFLGGPIGAVVTALTLGVAAWQAWGRSSDTENANATESTRRSTQSIIGDLNAQISKLKERNAARDAGNTVGASDTEAGARMRELQKDMRDIAAGVGKGLNLPAAARDDLLQKLGRQMGELYAAGKQLEEVQESTTKLTKDQQTQAWLEKNGNSAQKLAGELKKLKAEFGGVIPPEIEKATRAKFKDEETAFLAQFDSKQMQYEKARDKLRELRGGGEITPEEDARLREHYKERKKSDTEKLDAGERLAKQMEDRLAQLGAEGEAAQLNAQIAAGTVKFNTQADKERAIAAATAMDIITDTKKRADEAKEATDALLASIAEVSAPYDKNADDFLTRMGALAGSNLGGQAYEDAIKKTVRIAEGSTDQVTQFSIQAARSIQESLGDGLYAAVTGSFDSMGDAFLRTVTKMASDAAAAQLAKALFGDFGNTNSIGGGLLGTLFKGAVAAVGGVGGAITAGAGYGATNMVGESGVNAMSGSWLSTPRAIGGGTEPNTMRRVAERGPELYEEGGNAYLLSGKNYGNVTPLRAAGATSGGSGGGHQTNLTVVINGSDGSTSQNGSMADNDRRSSSLISGIRAVVEKVNHESDMQGGRNWNRRTGMAVA